MINTGFIMLQRQFIDWEWYSDVNTCKLFLHCLLKVNYSEKKWQGHVIHKGEFITSYEKLAIETGLTISKVRTALSKLIESNCLIVNTSTNFTKILIPNLGDFVVRANESKNIIQVDKRNSNQIAYDKQLNHKQMATTNTNNNLIKIRKKIFREDVYALSKFNSKILDSFFNYWSELSCDKTEMRFEEQKYFEIEKRLKKWVKNELSSEQKSNKKVLRNR